MSKKTLICWGRREPLARQIKMEAAAREGQIKKWLNQKNKSPTRKGGNSLGFCRVENRTPDKEGHE